MKRRGFLGLLAGAIASPIAKALPAPYALQRDTWTLGGAAPAPLDLTAFNQALKEIYCAEGAIADIVYVGNPLYAMLRCRAPGWNAVASIDPINEAPNRQTEESADGEGQGSEGSGHGEGADRDRGAGEEA